MPRFRAHARITAAKLPTGDAARAALQGCGRQRRVGTAEPARRAAAVGIRVSETGTAPAGAAAGTRGHVGDRGGGVSRRPVPGCSRGARRDRRPAGPSKTQGPGEARAAGKAPLIMAAARKRGARLNASASSPEGPRPFRGSVERTADASPSAARAAARGAQ